MCGFFIIGIYANMPGDKLNFIYIRRTKTSPENYKSDIRIMSHYQGDIAKTFHLKRMCGKRMHVTIIKDR